MESRRVTGRAFVVGDDVSAEQIVPARYLSCVAGGHSNFVTPAAHTSAEISEELYRKPLVEPGHFASEYSVVIAGRRFACGSSPLYAPAALVAAGIRVVIAETFACDLFESCVGRAGLYVAESEYRLCDGFQTGDWVEVDLASAGLRYAGSAGVYPLRSVRLMAVPAFAGALCAPVDVVQATALPETFPAWAAAAAAGATAPSGRAVISA